MTRVRARIKIDGELHLAVPITDLFLEIGTGSSRTKISISW